MKQVFIVSTAIGIGIWLIVQKRKRALFSPRWSTRQRVGGTLEQLQGAAKHTAGSVLGDAALTAEGIVQEAVGTVRSGTGKAVALVSNAVSS